MERAKKLTQGDIGQPDQGTNRHSDRYSDLQSVVVLQRCTVLDLDTIKRVPCIYVFQGLDCLRKVRSVIFTTDSPINQRKLLNSRRFEICVTQDWEGECGEGGRRLEEDPLLSKQKQITRREGVSHASDALRHSFSNIDDDADATKANSTVIIL